MDAYHLRRREKAITDDDALWAVLERQKYMTLALCSENRPYLVTVNYALERVAQRLYFHCAREGRKIDHWRANPAVYGQVMEDGGYLDGACDHAFRTVQFEGRVSFVEELPEKEHALRLLVDRLESRPEPVRDQLLIPTRISGVMVGRIDIESLTGKQNGR